METKLTNIYWLAGILDGEGYFGFAGTPQIQITMSDEDLIQRVKSISRCKTIIRSNKIPRHNDHYKRQYNLNICGVKAIEWMYTIYPIMSARRQARIREVINKWKQMPNQTESNLCPNGHALEGKNLMIDYSQSGIVRRCRICRKYQYRNRRLESISRSLGKCSETTSL